MGNMGMPLPALTRGGKGGTGHAGTDVVIKHRRGSAGLARLGAGRTSPGAEGGGGIQLGFTRVAPSTRSTRSLSPSRRASNTSRRSRSTGRYERRDTGGAGRNTAPPAVGEPLPKE